MRQEDTGNIRVRLTRPHFHNGMRFETGRVVTLPAFAVKELVNRKAAVVIAGLKKG